MQNRQNNLSAGNVIRLAREAASLSQLELARRVGTKQQTIEKIEAGKIGFSSFFASIAAELKIDPAKLMPALATKNGEPTFVHVSDLRSGERDFPVHAAAQGGPGELVVSSDPVAWVLRPTPLVGVSRAYGIIIVGESMIPEFWPGDTALINPHLPPQRAETCVFYSEKDGETKATLKHLLKWTDTAWFVRQWNAVKDEKEDFTLSRRDWTKCHRVVGKYSK